MEFNFNNIPSYDWGDLHVVELQADLGYQALMEINIHQSSLIDQLTKEFEEKVKNDKNFEELEEQFHGSYYGSMYEWDEWLIYQISIRQAYATCLSIYSFLEGQLKSICELIQQEFDFKVKLNDLVNSEDINRYWLFLSKVYSIDLDPLDPYYTKIKQQKNIRNIIAHNEGYAKAEYRNKIINAPGLKIKELDNQLQILITTDYNLFLLKESKNLLDNLLLIVDKRYQQLKFRN
jgi:hypothetical protein